MPYGYLSRQGRRVSGFDPDAPGTVPAPHGCRGWTSQVHIVLSDSVGRGTAGSGGYARITLLAEVSDALRDRLPDR